MTKNIVIIGLILVFNSCGNKKTEIAEENGAVKEAFLENVKTEKVVLSN